MMRIMTGVIMWCDDMSVFTNKVCRRDMCDPCKGLLK